MGNVNFQNVTSLFIKTIRGEQSQDSLSHDLEANFNIVGRWETGQRGFYWEDFLSLADLKNWQLAKALEDVTHFKFLARPSGGEVLSEIILPSSRELLKSHFSSQKMSRLMTDQSKLLFNDFLLIIEVLYGRSQRFLNFFMPKGVIGQFDPLYSQTDNYGDFLANDPRISLLSMVLTLKAYKDLPSHSDEFVAGVMNMPVEEVKAKLGLLSQTGAIVMEGTHYRTNSAFVDTGASNKKSSASIVDYWRQQICEYTESGKGRSDLVSAYLLYETSPELEEKVFELCRNFYMDVKNLLTEFEGKNDKSNMRFMLIDLFYPLGSVLNATGKEKTDFDKI